MLNKYPIIRLVFILIFCTLIQYNIDGQECRLRHYVDDNKLNINYISHLVFDSNQNIWIGSNAGLYVFNGQYFIDLTDKLKHPRITFLFNGKEENSISVVDYNFNLYHFDTKDFKVHRELKRPEFQKLELDISKGQCTASL